MLSWARLAWTGAALMIFGCGADSTAPDAAQRDGGSGDANVIGGDAGGSDAAAGGDAAVGVSPPANDSFETARALVVGTAPLQDITHEGQVDYYAFEGEAGAYYALSTERTIFTPDTVIALFDADQQLLAENDDGPMWPGDNIDSRLVVRLSRGGTHFVRVQNHVVDPVRPPVFYHVTLKQLAADADGVALQVSEQPAQVHFALDELSGYSYATLVGDFAAVQRAAFEFAGQRAQVLVGHLLPAGPEQNGSTAHVGLVRTADSDEHLISTIDGAKEQHEFHPPIDDGIYRLTADLDGAPGANGFFAIDLVMLPDNPRELVEAENDTLDGADNVELEQEMFRRRGLLLSSLGAGDVDYYRFEAPVLGAVTVVCEGASGGSGVQGLRAELRDSADKTLVAADEPADSNLLIDGFPLPEIGTYYLRLSSSTKASKDAIEPWVRCVVIARP